ANDNMQVVCPTTPAQIFHLLRRQYLINTRKPMIIMSPKSMLRNKASVSTLEDLTTGSFKPVLVHQAPPSVRRIILCSGKVYFDLLEAQHAQQVDDLHVVRLERLYPFPSALLQEELSKFADCKEVLWLQEEPANQGAWLLINSDLRRVLLPEQKLYGLARPALAAPAVGALKRHKEQKEKLLADALALNVAGFMV
ncbi:MAG: 2-oxoglutarate dehydrogenase E1 component, partial [Ghiorsea sp.]